MKRKAGGTYRREPQQRRARETVEAVLDAVVRILKRGGIEAVTTNRVAEVAGVSIGSVYQYFRDKRAIFAALHERHIQEIDRLVETKLMEHAASPLDTLMRAMIEAMVDAHTSDPELYELLSTVWIGRAHETLEIPVNPTSGCVNPFRSKAESGSEFLIFAGKGLDGNEYKVSPIAVPSKYADHKMQQLGPGRKPK